jgi:hypothetical protein
MLFGEGYETKGEMGAAMKKDRRDFIKASAAIGMFGVTEASAQTPKKIGFVVSTRDNTNHVLSFMQALEDRGWSGSDKVRFFWESAEGAYGSSHTELPDHAKKHIDRGVDLIVAAGGLMSAIAVAQVLRNRSSSIKFVYLIGRTPLSSDPNYGDTSVFATSNNKAGGVDQNIVTQNEKNCSDLYQISSNGVTPGNVGLIVNHNNVITAPEIKEWKNGHGHTGTLIFDVTAENDQQMSAVFGKISSAGAALAGLVVSSDPYFRSFAPDFDKKLRAASGGKFKGYVCYPYQEYMDYLDPAYSSKSVKSKYTPTLATDDDTTVSIDKRAYYQLGLKVVDFLNGTNPAVATWNGTQWT